MEVADMTDVASMVCRTVKKHQRQPATPYAAFLLFLLSICGVVDWARVRKEATRVAGKGE